MIRSQRVTRHRIPVLMRKENFRAQHYESSCLGRFCRYNSALVTPAEWYRHLSGLAVSGEEIDIPRRSTAKEVYNNVSGREGPADGSDDPNPLGFLSVPISLALL